MYAVAQDVVQGRGHLGRQIVPTWMQLPFRVPGAGLSSPGISPGLPERPGAHHTC